MLTQAGACHSPGARSGPFRSACPCQPLSASDPAGRLQSSQQLHQPSVQLHFVHGPVRLLVSCSSTTGVSQVDSKAHAPIAASQWQSDSPHQHFHNNFLHVAAPLAPQHAWQNTQHQQRKEQQQSQQPLQPWPGEVPTAAAASAVHDAASPARSAISEAATPAAAAADVAMWRVLQLQDPQDLLSVRIVSCATVEHLLTTAQEVAQHGNKLQAARLTVSAAILVQQQPQQHILGAVLHQSSADVAGQLFASNSTPAAIQQHATGAADTLELQLVDKVVLALTCSTSAHVVSALRALSSRHLAETLYALHLLSQQSSPGQHQHLQERISLQAAQIPQQHILSAIHACSSAQQLSAVVGWLQNHLTQTHVKAAFVQLARVVASSSSCNGSSSNPSSGTDSSLSHSLAAETAAAQGLLQLLLRVLQKHQQPLQPHAAASILWSLGQLQPLLSDTPTQLDMQHLAQEAFEAALAGLHRLNHRVCAMMLHGAAKLRLQVPGDAVAELILQHTTHQLDLCDSQALATLLWSFAQLQLQPSNGWLHAFYGRSLQLLQPQEQQQLQQQRPVHSANTSRVNGSTQQTKALRQVQDKRHSMGAARHYWGQQQDEQQGLQQQPDQQQRHQQQRRESSSLKPQELAAILSSLVHLGLCPHVKWLVAAACSCHLQLQRFKHQELALVLWAFAKWQQQQGFAVPEQLINHAGRRIQHLLADSSSTSSSACNSSSSSFFSPKSLSLLLYAVVKLQLQPQDILVQQLWQQLQRNSHGSWPEVLGHMPYSLELPATQQPMAAAVAVAAESAHSQLDAATDSAARLHSADYAAAAAVEHHGVNVGSWVNQVYSQSADKLPQYNAHDLALLAWGLATKQHQQRDQHQAEQLGPPSAEWVTSYMAAAGKQLELRSFIAQGVCMMLWGLGVLVTQANTAGSGGRSSVSGNGAPSSKQCQAVAAAFWAALEQQIVQNLAQFSMFELSNIVWGAGAVHRYLGGAGVVSTFEWVDLVACQCLDGIEQLPISQAVTALQGLVWLKHPKGLGLLQQLLSDRRTGQLVALQPHEVVLVLRGCAYYKHMPEQRVLQQLLAMIRQQLVAVQEPVAAAAANLAQVLHALGKMQQQYTKLQKQQDSSRGGDRSAGRADQQQVISLVPSYVVLELVECLIGRLASCPAKEVSRMLWGLGQLLSPKLMQPQQQRQSTATSSKLSFNSSTDEPIPVAVDTACSASGGEMDQRSHVALADHPVGQQLLQEVYNYSKQHLDKFHPYELAMLMHSVHKLGVVHPPAQWLSAVVAHVTPLMGQMHGQGLAVLIASLSGFNWLPAQGWLSAYVDAAVAADACGRIETDWQQACIQHGLSALDPIVGEAWQRRRSTAHSGRLPPSSCRDSIRRLHS